MPKTPDTARALRILTVLKKTYPDARCELDFKGPLQLLVATILSAQCTDVRVNLVTPALFARYPTARDYAAADVAELEELIRSTGFYKNKARSILGATQKIVADFKGKVPSGMEELTSLPGVGRKTAHVVRMHGFGFPGIACDTHVLRITKRLGFTRHEDPAKVEEDLAQLLPEKHWTDYSTRIIIHGRRTCMARKPACSRCSIMLLCPYKNI